MKKIIVLTILGILTFSLISCDNNFRTKNTISNNDVENSNSKAIDETIALENADNIKVEIYAAQVSVKGYDGEDIKISGRLSENSDGFNINKNGDTIYIIEKGYEVFRKIINTEDNKTKINILIPAKFKGNFEFKQGVGTTEIEGINLKNISITGGAGELKCDNIVFDNFNLNSAVGEVNLNFSKKCGNITIIGGVGNTNINISEVGGNLIYNGGIGEANIIIPTNSPVKFITHKGVGKCDINAKTSDQEDYTFNLKVGVGSINVRN